MNITYFSHYFAPEIGAPSARIYDLGGQWIKQGHEVGVVTCLPNHPTGRLYSGYEPRWRMRETLNGISVYRHWTYITPNKGFVKKTLGHLSYLAGSRVFSEPKIATTDVGIGTSPTFFAAMSAAAFCRRRRIPFIMEVRDLWPAIFVELGVLRNRRVIRLLERWEMGLYRQASRIVVVTESFRRKLIERGISAHKLVTIPNGADIEFWSPGEDSHRLRQELNLKDRFIVLYIGAHGISHALDRILDTAAELQKHPQIHFLFVGEGAEKEGLEQRAKELKLTNITFRGSVSKDEVK